MEPCWIGDDTLLDRKSVVVGQAGWWVSRAMAP